MRNSDSSSEVITEPGQVNNGREKTKQVVRTIALLGALTLARGDSRLPVNYDRENNDVPKPLVADISSLENVKPKPANQLLYEYFHPSNEPSLNEQEIQILNTLNSQGSSIDQYIAAINSWNTNLPIFRYLDSPSSKVRFIQYVLAQDTIDSNPYYTPAKYYVDANNDGVGEILPDPTDSTRVINELGDVFLLSSYVCVDFARDMRLAYGMESENKFSMPLLEVYAYKGEDSEEPFAGHAVNAVYIGDPDGSSYYLSAWHFFEPQLDGEIIDLQTGFISDARLLVLTTKDDVSEKEYSSMLHAYLITPSGIIYNIGPEQYSIVTKIVLGVQIPGMAPRLNGKVVDQRVYKRQDFSMFSSEQIYDLIGKLVDSKIVSSDSLYDVFSNPNSTFPNDFSLDKLAQYIQYAEKFFKGLD